MKTKMIFFVIVVLTISAGIFWIAARHPFTTVAENSGGRKVLYYTCAMHPWVREHKPGLCPVCGMKLVPIYEQGSSERKIKYYQSTMKPGETSPTPAKDSMGMDMTPVYEDNEETNLENGTVTLESESISTINVQTDMATNRPVQRTIHLSGQITGNSYQAAWFEFTAYQRDFKWLKIGQTLHIVVEGVPDKIFTAQIKLNSIRPFADENFDMMSSSTTMRAEISNPPVEVSNFGKYKLFDGLHAEAHVVAETENVLAVPRSAIISRGMGAMVYVDKGNGHYAPRAIELGRIGDEFAEVTAGLKEGEKVVTNGNVLIDSEARLTAGE